LGSSEYNARQIADYLTRQFAGTDRRQYIAFGYSKGVNDLLETVASHEIGRTGIRAIVTVAGPVLGSRLTEGVPRDLGIARADHWAVALPFDDVPQTNPAYKVIRQLINHNTYPRVALFESALRYVLAELP
jgi:hypothetical protein